MMNNEQLILSKNAFELLSNHLKLSMNLSEYNKKKLTVELKSAKIMEADALPVDVVGENSKVCIEDIENGQTFTFILVNPKDANMKSNKLSIMAPIGVALLGYRPGIEVDWEMPNGLKSFRIISVERTSDNSVPVNVES